MKIDNTARAFSLLRIFLGVVFLAAALYRIFQWNGAVIEFSKFSATYAHLLLFVTLFIETAGGILLLANIKTKKVALALSVFILFAIFTMLAAQWQTVLGNLHELFSFDSTPTDVFLHITYLVILISIIFYYSGKE